ncbi:prolyl-tRNA synthetase [Kaistella carnis]|uniref:prolyl-tRNA synthetase n=1 Tax=Kaistella carnis TaxID=1241979 RepID=UPI0028A962E3|nr:prolyl-tRNA synthetase [Kaistella carnis]
MKNITYKNVLNLLKSKSVLAVMGGLLLSSCMTTMGGYSETDGVYYDPNRDTLPEGMVMSNGNRIGDYYDYQAVDDQNKYLNAENRNQNWQDAQDSDWGIYTGTDTYYNDYWGYPYGFGLYSGFGFGMSYGFGYSGYYNPWGYGYGPFSNYYSPFYGYYNPYYGYYGSPYYYGYNAPYYNYYGNGFNSYNAPRFQYKRSGADNGFRNSNSGVRQNTNQNSGFRNDNIRSNDVRNTNPRSVQPNINQQRYRTSPQINNPRQNSTPRQSMPSSEPRYRSNSSDNGFRSGNTGGGFNSGSSSSSSGSTRSSGGFRR